MKAAARVPARLLGIAAAGALALAAALWFALQPAPGAEARLELTAPMPRAQADIAPVSPGSPVSPATASTAREALALPVPESGTILPARSEADPEARARAAVETLRGAIEPDRFSTRSFDREARVLAGGLRAAAGAGGVAALERIAQGASSGERESVAAAELLRHVGAAELPGNALAALRRAFEGRAGDATLALAAAAALGRFGDLEDRRAMLEAVSENGPAIDATLALAGLGAARGDGPVLEMAEAMERSFDARRREVALCALTQVVSAGDHGLSESGRARCAELLHGELLAALARGESPSRVVAALAVLEPEEAARRMLAMLADPRSSEGTAQGVASRLASMPIARADLEAVAANGSLPDGRRVLAIEALARVDRKVSAEGRALLERVRERGAETPLGRRAARVLERAEAGMASAVGEEPDG